VSQITVTWVQRQRPTSTVHLAGSFILSHVASALYSTKRRERCSNVLTLVSLMIDVRLLSGIMSARIIDAAGYTSLPRVVDVIIILPSCSLTSSDNVRQVHDVTTCHFTYHFLEYSANDFLKYWMVYILLSVPLSINTECKQVFLQVCRFCRLSVCLSVCLSAGLSSNGAVEKRLIGSGWRYG